MNGFFLIQSYYTVDKILQIFTKELKYCKFARTNPNFYFLLYSM